MISSILDAVPLPAVFIDTKLRIQGANPQARALQPIALEQRAFILVFRQPGLNVAIENCLRTKETQRAIYSHADEGHEIKFQVTCSYVQMGSEFGIMACFQDITQLEQAGAIRREFVANVSHELKTPLTALLGFIETLQGPAKNDANARERFLGIMASEANRMNRLVGDLLSLSRVEEEARMRPKETIDLRDVLSTVRRNLGEVIKDRGVTLDFQLSDQPMTVPADRDQLLQVFTNLVENALKYGDQNGVVTVSLQQSERDPKLRKPAVTVAVKDTGAGIAPEHIPRLTERFYRIDSHRSRELGGTGLGLAIVKHIVARHRGHMKIESDLGKGSKFSVILPKT